MSTKSTSESSATQEKSKKVRFILIMLSDKYQFDDVNENDIIIERIRVVEYESSSVNSKCNNSAINSQSGRHIQTKHEISKLLFAILYSTEVDKRKQ